MQWDAHLDSLRERRAFGGLRVEVRKADGSSRYFVTSGRPVFDDRGEFRGYRGAAVDITDRELAEREAARAHARLGDAIENISDGFILYDADERLVLCNEKYREFNPSFQDILVPGARLEDIIRTSAASEGAPLGGDDIDSWTRMRLRDYRAGTGSREILHADGRWILASERRMSDGGVVGLRADITDRKRAEDELRLSEERFRDVTESISDWLWEMGPDLRYTYVSPQAYQRTGFRSDRFLGKTREELGPPAGNLDGWRRHIEDLKAHRPFRDYSHERILANGKSMHILLSGKPLHGAEGEFLGYRGTARDITATVEAERQAKRSEERFQYAIKNSSDGFALYDADEKLVIFNTKFLENSMLGAPFLSIGISFEDVVTALAEQGSVAGVDEHNKKEWIDERLAGFRARTAVPEYQMSNGRWRQARYDGLPDGSTIARYLDITDQKRQRDALRESEERFALAAAGTNDGIWDFDFQSGEVYRSARLLEILGYDEPEFRPNLDEFLDYLHPDDRDGRVKAFTAHIEERTPYDHEFRLRHKSGEYIWVRASGQAVWDEDGKPLRMAGSIADISERKRAEDALRASEERFSAVFNNSPSAMSLKDSDGHFRLVNEKFAAQLGSTAEAMAGKSIHDVLPAEQAEAFVEQDRMVLEQGIKIIREHEVSFPDGKIHSVVVTKFPVLDRDGQILGVGEIDIDVTEQRKTEAMLNQAQRMEAVGQLTGGIAHEFNNLLMVVVGNIELLKSHLPKDGHLERFASTAMKGALRGAELTQRLLTFSRKQTLAIVPVDLNDLVLTLGDMLRRTLGATITLELELAESLPKALADKGQIEGALLNFILNSRDAMANGGTVGIRTASRALDAEAAVKADAEPGYYVSLEITDTGHGMTAETVEQAFEPFFTTKDVGEGTGLGLSVAYGFAKQSGGFVEIDSEVGRGTTVRLCLPGTGDAQRVEADETPIGPGPDKAGATILVVEDDPDVRDLVVKLLIGLGYDVVQAGDGRTALARLEERSDIDLLFTDVVLPHGMSGHDVAREARRRHPALKVVFTTGYPDQEHGNLSLDDEDPVVISKPYRKSVLAETLAAALGG